LCVGFDSIALFEFGEIIKHYATLIASGNLAYIVSTSSKGGDFAIVRQFFVALNTSL